MKISRIIGVTLIIVSLYFLYESYTLKKEVRGAYEVARLEVILNSNQLELNETKTFKTTYRYAHGFDVRNAKEKENERPPDLTVVLPDGDTVDLVYAKGSESPFRLHEGPIKVKRLTQFEGEITFLNSVCGCENMGPFIMLLVSLAVCIIFIPLGLYLSLKKNSNQAGDDNSE